MSSSRSGPRPSGRGAALHLRTQRESASRPRRQAASEAARAPGPCQPRTSTWRPRAHASGPCVSQHLVRPVSSPSSPFGSARSVGSPSPSARTSCSRATCPLLVELPLYNDLLIDHTRSSVVIDGQLSPRATVWCTTSPLRPLDYTHTSLSERGRSTHDSLVVAPIGSTNHGTRPWALQTRQQPPRQRG